MDLLENFNILGSFSGGASFFLDALFIALIISAFFIPMFFIIWLTSFKHFITVRQVTGGKIVVKRDRAKIVKDKLGVEKLKLLSTPKFMKGDRIGLPPDEAVLTTNKGKLIADVYRTQNSQYIWVVDKGLNKKIKYPDGSTEDNFFPLDTMDRSFYADEWEEAEKYKKKTLLEVFEKTAPWAIIFLMFAVLIFNWDAIAKPALESQQVAIKMQDQNLEYQKELQKTTAILKGVQVVEDKTPPK